MCSYLCHMLILLLVPTFGNGAKYEIEAYQSITEKIQIMTEYFHWKHLKFGILINCYDNLVLKRIVHQFSQKMISIFVTQDSLQKLNASLHSYLKMKTEFHHVGIVLDMNCPLTLPLLNYVSENEMFTEIFHWLVFHSQNHSINTFQYINVPINSDLLIIQKQLFLNQWILHEIYNPGIYHGGTLKYSYYGSWSDETGFKIFANDNLYGRRQDTGGVRLRAGIVVRTKLKIPVMDFLNTDGYLKFDVYTRFHHRIIQNVKQMYNFRFKYIRADDWVYGLVGNLVNKRLDIGNNGVFITQERKASVYFCPMGLLPFRIVFLFRHPKANSGGLSDTFLRPLTYSVWSLSVISAIVIIILLKITVITETRKLMKESDSENSWSMAAFVTFGALVQQGIDSTPTLFSGRMIIYTLLVFSSLLYQFYSASIVSSLLMEPPKTIKTLQDLYDSPLEIGLNNEPYIVSWYKDIKNPLEVQIYGKKIMRENKYPPHIYPIITGLNKVHKGGFAYECMVTIISGYITITAGWTEREICDLSQIQMRPDQRLFFICQKKLPFRKIFNIGILKQVERGITSYETKKWQQGIPECTIDALSSSTFSVKLTETASAFALLGFGMLVSIMILLLEIMVHIKKTKSNTYVIPNK